MEKSRTEESYFAEKMGSKSKSSINSTRKAILKFEQFCSTTHHKTKDEVISELLKFDSEKKDKITLELFQDFVNYLKQELSPASIHVYFAFFKRYIKYMIDSKLHVEDIKDEVEFPEIIEEEAYPLKHEEIKELLKNAKLTRQAFYLTSLSSGMREQEMCKLRKRDFDDSLSRIMVTIPAKYTKTKKSRKTFISSEAGKYLKPILEKLGPDDLVFGTNTDSETSAFNEIGAFKLVRKKAGLDHLRYDSGVHKITIHSFRSFFITQTEKINEGLGHALAGHSRYMKRYERYDEKDLLNFYLKVEPNLLIFENHIEGHEELKAKVVELEEKQSRINEQEQRIRNLEIMVSNYSDFIHVTKQTLRQPEFVEAAKKIESELKLVKK